VSGVGGKVVEGNFWCWRARTHLPARSSPSRRARNPLCHDVSSARVRAPGDEHVTAERDAMNRPIVLDGCFRGTPRQKALEMDL